LRLVARKRMEPASTDATTYRKGDVMKAVFHTGAWLCGAAILAVALVPAASACGGDGPVQSPFVMQAIRADQANPLEGASAESVARDQRAAAGGRASIVGMWKITETSLGNPSIKDGSPIDFGYAQWHSDGTEFYNSGGFAPATQNYCLGVWVQTGNYTYQVNHFALTYDPTGVYTGIINILETLTLSPGGTRYSGTFTINGYDTNGNQVKHLTGQVTGERVTIDTTP